MSEEEKEEKKNTFPCFFSLLFAYKIKEGECLHCVSIDRLLNQHFFVENNFCRDEPDKSMAITLPFMLLPFMRHLANFSRLLFLIFILFPFVCFFYCGFDFLL
jgi:hypothetical protein